MSSFRKKTDFFHKSFDATACKTSSKLVIARAKLLRNMRDAQVKTLRREVAKLLESDQEESARLKVEHVIREEMAMSAYELIELYCEIIVARLPVIESQRHCPIDLKEAVCSVIFAQARCADLPELKTVGKLLTHKYGKDFANAAINLRPDCGVSSVIVEKLSAKPPNIETKVRILSAIATEHGIDWKPKQPEEQVEQPREELLGGPRFFPAATNFASGAPKSEFVTQVVPKQETGPDPINHRFSSILEGSSVAMNSGQDGSPKEPNFSESQLAYLRNKEHQSMLNQQILSSNFKDAASAAEAAAKSAEMASLAAKAAADFALRANDPTIRKASPESKQSEPAVQLYDRQTSKYMATSSKENSRHGGDGSRGKGDSSDSRSNMIMSRPNSNFIEDNDGTDGTSHDTSSSEKIAAEEYPLKEKVDVERYQPSVEQGRGTRKVMAAEKLESHFERHQNEGSFSRRASARANVDFSDYSSSPRTTVSVASSAQANTGNIQEHMEVISSVVSEQDVVRRKPLKKKSSKHDDDDDRSFRSTSSRSVMNKGNSKYGDLTYGTHEEDTWKEDVATEERNGDLLSRSGRQDSSDRRSLPTFDDDNDYDVDALINLDRIDSDDDFKQKRSEPINSVFRHNITAKNQPPHYSDEESQSSYHNNERKPFRDLSPGVHENPSSGRKKWNDPGKVIYDPDDQIVQMNSKISVMKVATAERVEARSSDSEGSENVKELELGVLLGGLRNRPRNHPYLGPTTVEEGGSRFTEMMNDSSAAEVDKDIGAGHRRRRWDFKEPSKDPFSMQRLPDQRGTLKDKYEKTDRSYSDDTVDPQPRPSSLRGGSVAGSRRVRVSNMGTSRQEFGDRRPKLGNRNERGGSLTSILAYDEETDEVDGSPKKSVASIYRKEHSRRSRVTGSDSKMVVPEKDFNGNKDREVNTKLHFRSSSSASSAEKHSTPVHETLDSLSEEETVISPPRYSGRNASTEREIEGSSTLQSPAPERSSTRRVEAKPVRTRSADQQLSTPPVRDSGRKESSPENQANLPEKQHSIPPVRDLRRKESSPTKRVSLPENNPSVPQAQDSRQEEPPPIKNIESVPSASSGNKNEPESTNPGTSEKPKGQSHVHPKLPTDFDSFMANFQSLRANARRK